MAAEKQTCASTSSCPVGVEDVEKQDNLKNLDAENNEPLEKAKEKPPREYYLTCRLRMAAPVNFY